MKADYVHKDTRTIVVDGVEIQTSLTAVEIASLQQENQELQQENKILKENAENNDKVVDKVNWENQLFKKENEQLKGNWNKLKEFIVKEYYMYLPLEASTKSITILIDKMQELQGSDSNE